MVQSDLSSQPTEIAIWGPTQSGKDRLYRAFAKELEEYDGASNDFNFVLQERKFGDATFRLTMAIPPNSVQPTSEEEDYVLRFIRKPKPGKNSEDYSLSAHQHDMFFHNNRGANLIASVIDPDSSYFQSTRSSIINSRYLLIVLDPQFDTSSEDPLGTQAANNDTQNVYPLEALRPGPSKEKYYRMLYGLLDTIGSSKNTDRHLAVCITKTDLLKITSYNAWNLLERAFGTKIFKLFNTYRGIFNIEVFATSAAGYIRRGGKTIPNYDDEGKLISEDDWRPVNCAAPFFWIFQNKEIERIKATSNFLNRDYNLRKYIRYPLQIAAQ